MRRCLSGRCKFSTGRKVGGNLFVWGRISDGRLGMKAPETCYTATNLARPGGPTTGPLQHPTLRDVVSVVCRGMKTLALTADGSVYSWGTCENFSLGHGDKVSQVATPTKVAALAGIRIVQIDAGETSSAAVSEEGEVFTWGWGGSFFGGNGGLGHGTTLSQPTPALVEGLVSSGVRVSSLSVGTSHMLALASDGVVWSWGNGEYGRCGNGMSSQKVPAPVELLTERGSRCVSVAAGGAHSLVATDAGEVWAWGKNEAAQLGLGVGLVADLHNMEEYPLLVDLEGENGGAFNRRAGSVSAGNTHSLVITGGGGVWQWGARTFIAPTHAPTAVLGKAGREGGEGGSQAELPLVAHRVFAGDGVSGVLDEKGRLFSWGKGFQSSALGQTSGVLGTPAQVDLPGKVIDASFGTHHGGAVVLA